MSLGGFGLKFPPCKINPATGATNVARFVRMSNQSNCELHLFPYYKLRKICATLLQQQSKSFILFVLLILN